MTIRAVVFDIGGVLEITPYTGWVEKWEACLHLRSRQRIKVSIEPVRGNTALLTNSFAGAREKEQERYHFAEMCDLLVYSHEQGIAKPDRRIFELTCERLGVQPAEMIFLDDHERPVAAAHALGIHDILFENTAQAIATIEACLQTHAS